MSASALDQLKTYTRVVADTGDFKSIMEFYPEDATTNPSLILKAAKQEEYKDLVNIAKRSVQKKETSNRVGDIIDNLVVLFGIEILKIVKGRVSTEVDARLSFDVNGTIEKAKTIIQLYEKNGISRDRILIKIASTWEGILSAKMLEMEGIHCNLTLMFSKVQAVACADANVTLISPFVGRVLDWHSQKTNQKFLPDDDPGVQLVGNIFNYYKYFGHTTEIMGASFRNVGEILALAGCDLLTISPTLLSELQSMDVKVEKKLSVKSAKILDIEKISFDEKRFRYELNQDAMATEKLAEGIRLFVADIEKLEQLLT